MAVAEVDSKLPAGEAAAADVAIPETEPDNSSKLKSLLGILRRFIGVSDLASIRFSLPAHLMEPIPNLEYWNYLDRPEAFASIGDSEDSTGRMLEVLRFWFTKDLKYVKGKPCKPYNSTLGEFFRCNWTVEELLPDIKSSIKPSSGTTSSAASIASNKSANKDKEPAQKIRISYLTEQTSHHPPVSAYIIECPEKKITARGYDQISAKFTGTSVRVTPGNHNLGIFIDLKQRDEEYQLTHPAAYVGGLLRGTLSISVSDTCFITCPKTKTKAILEYLEDGWLGGARNRVQGAIFTYDPQNDITSQKVKDVPEKSILARIEGSWNDKLYYTIGSGSFASTEPKYVIIDLNPLFPVPKETPPIEAQLSNESQRFWQDVTSAIKGKQYSKATTLKVAIEDRQRAKAAERKEKGTEWLPRFFTGAVTPAGKPELTDEGKAAMKGLEEQNWSMTEGANLGA